MPGLTRKWYTPSAAQEGRKANKHKDDSFSGSTRSEMRLSDIIIQSAVPERASLSSGSMSCFASLGKSNQMEME